MDSDEDDFVFYGTPIEREEEMTSRKKKSVAEAAGLIRSLPPWKQEVIDEEGRRRFHGAFTGGFSAGFYNTVGSKEGWTPQAFTSSRKNRAEVKEQSIFNFLDDDEKAEMEGQSLGTSLKFDTFGFTAAELSRKQAEEEQQKRPSVIPGPVPDEIVLPATNSIGIKLLQKMGWRHGHSISDSRTNSLYDARREARKAFLAFSSNDAKATSSQLEPNKSDPGSVLELFIDNEGHASQSTPVFVLNPKQDLHGLGYDPFRHAPEFRERKRLRVSGSHEPGNRRAMSMGDNLFAKSRKVAPGFGIGALEELDAEDEDIYASGFDFEETSVQEIEEPSRISGDNKQPLGKNEQGVLPGFKVASNSDYQLERFHPPVIPSDFEPHHKFSAPLEIGSKLTGPPPLDIPPPEDNSLRLLIEGFAILVARCGKLFEDLSREKNKTNPLFCFLSGGNGHDYYARKLWEEQQKHSDQTKQHVDVKSAPSVQKMTAESRGRILGERPLERSSKDSSSSVASADVIQLQFNLSDTFTKPVALSESLEAAKPFKSDPAKQERFEQFLKEKYQGGLRSTDSGGNSNMSEADRAREKLDFEAAAEAIQKGQWGPSTKLSSNQQFMENSATANMQFISGGLEQAKVAQFEEQMVKKKYPKREEFPWQPSSILCKRFNIIDPYMGKPPPLRRARSRMDSLIFTADFVKAAKAEENVATSRDSLPISQSEPLETSTETGNELNNTNVERPVDLYKAIFSDDSDDEGEGSTSNQVEDPQKKTEVAKTTLNRLIAGDFLESLGKELGLEVPPEPPLVVNKGYTSVSKETISASAEDNKIPSGNDKPSSAQKSLNGPLEGQITLSGIIQEGAYDTNELEHGSPRNSGWKTTSTGHFEMSSRKDEFEKMVSENKKKLQSRRHYSQSSSASSEDEKSRKHASRHVSPSSSASSEDERARTHSRRHRNRKSASETDSSEYHGYQDSSKLKSDKKGSSQGKSSRRKHLKHHRSRGNDSHRNSSHHGSEREHTEDRKVSRLSRDQRRDFVSSKSDSRRKYR